MPILFYTKLHIHVHIFIDYSLRDSFNGYLIFSVKEQSELDARIKLIQKKNAAIIQRQREIDEDRKMFQ